MDAPCGEVRGRERVLVSPHGEKFVSYAFLGIPFAEAPVGALRFMAPVRRARFDSRTATEYGPTPQRHGFKGVTAIPEPSIPGDDTLLLNVFTPRPGDRSAGLPVLVWIHGGGFVAGSPASPWYDGQAFNRDGAVTVSISYRLGFDGFGYVSDSDAPTNRGLLDQIMALEWVRDNIAAFGGDPGNVTIGGQSAGGNSALALLVSPRATGLFARIIAQSPGGFFIEEDAARAAAEAFAKQAACPPDLAGFRTLTEEQMYHARIALDTPPSIPDGPHQAVRAIRALRETGSLSTITWGPVIGDDVVPRSLDGAVSGGVGAGIPLFIGDTTNEMTAFAQSKLHAWRGVKPLALLHELGFPRPIAWDYLRRHPELKGQAAYALGQVVSDAVFHLPIASLVRARHDARPVEPSDPDAGVTCGAHKAPTWYYEWAWPRPDISLAGHCVDVPFAFDCLSHPYVAQLFGGPAPQSLADAMHGDWMAFIRGEELWSSWYDERRIYGERGKGDETMARLRRMDRYDVARRASAPDGQTDEGEQRMYRRPS